MLDHGNTLPPGVTGTAELIPGVDHDLIHGVLDQAGEIGGG